MSPRRAQPQSQQRRSSRPRPFAVGKAAPQRSAPRKTPRERARRRALEERRALANTRRVKRLRIALPLFSAVIAVGLIGAAIVPKLMPLSALAGLSLTADGLVMNEPRLAGHLGDGRRYQVVAERAVQSLFTPSHLSLEGLQADLDMGAGERVSMAGREATYDTHTEILRLPGGVTIDSTDGNHVEVNAATVFLKKGRVEGEGGIRVTSPKGEIRAGSIDILEGGALIRLTGGVSIRIHPAL